MSTNFGDMLVWLGLNDAGLKAAIPGKIHADKIPETEPQTPWAYFVTASADPPSSLSGNAAKSCEYCTMSLFIKASSMAEKAAAGAALKAAFENLGQGVVTVNGMRFAALRVRSRSSSEESLGDGNDDSFRGWDYQITGWSYLGS